MTYRDFRSASLPVRLAHSEPVLASVRPGKLFLRRAGDTTGLRRAHATVASLTDWAGPVATLGHGNTRGGEMDDEADILIDPLELDQDTGED